MSSRYINADELVSQLEFAKAQMLNEPMSVYFLKSVIELLNNFEDSIKYGWNNADDLPPLHHVVDDDGESVIEYDTSGPLIVCTSDGWYRAAQYSKGCGYEGWEDGSSNVEGVTRWMPLPAPTLNSEGEPENMKGWKTPLGELVYPLFP